MFARSSEREGSHNELAILYYRLTQENGACGWNDDIARYRIGGFGFLKEVGKYVFPDFVSMSH